MALVNFADIDFATRCKAARRVMVEEKADAERRLELFLIAVFPPGDSLVSVRGNGDTAAELTEEERLERHRRANRRHYVNRPKAASAA